MSVRAAIEAMAVSTSLDRKLTHKEVRALWVKARRRAKRQTAAKLRGSSEERAKSEGAVYPSKESLEYERAKARWIQREREIEAENEKIRREREQLAAKLAQELLQVPVQKSAKAIVTTEPLLESLAWHNPLDLDSDEPREKCGFFDKTGSCRYGDKCSRKHEKPVISNTMVIRGMYASGVNYMEERDKFDSDIALEQEDSVDPEKFLDFREDVLKELKVFGKIDRFYVCCNFAHHLRGNVYVQYRTEMECATAVKNCFSRWYGGKPLYCEFVSIENWDQAVCGCFKRTNGCPRGNRCNYLHVINHHELLKLCEKQKKRNKKRASSSSREKLSKTRKT